MSYKKDKKWKWKNIKKSRGVVLGVAKGIPKRNGDDERQTIINFIFVHTFSLQQILEYKIYLQ